MVQPQNNGKIICFGYVNGQIIYDKQWKYILIAVAKPRKNDV